MQRKHVTLQILWKEYLAAHPDGYQYSCFCDPSYADAILDRLVHNARLDKLVEHPWRIMSLGLQDWAHAC